MTATLENTSALGRKLTINVPAEKVDKTYQEKLEQVSKTARVDGFRAGKVPLKRIEELHGQKVQSEVVDTLLKESLFESLEKHDLQPVGRPSIDSINFELGKPLEYTASFEIYPQIEISDFSQLSVERFESEITDADLELTLQNICEQFKKWEEVQQSAKNGDQVIIDAVGKKDGEVFQGGTLNDASLILGSGRFIPGFEEGLIGVNPGETRDLMLTFPESYHEKTLAGQPVTFTVTVKKVLEGKISELDEEFVKRMGVTDGNIETFKEQVKKHMQTQLEHHLSALLKNAVFEKLIENNSVEIPSLMLETEIKRLHDQQHKQAHDHNEHSQEERAQWEKEARKNIAMMLLMSEIINKNHLSPNSEKVHQLIEQEASVYEDPHSYAAWVMNDKKQLKNYEALALEAQIVDMVLEKAQVVISNVPYKEVYNLKSK